MSTVVIDRESMQRFQYQEPQRPWRKRPPVFTVSVAVAILVPLAIALFFLFGTSIPDPIVMIVIYLPLQLIAAGLAALVSKGKHGVVDSGIYVLAIGGSIFSLVILTSLIVTLFANGLKAFSVSFLTQNNVYISPSTPLEYGGVGHAVLGTLLIVFISMLFAIPIGVATAVYVTEVRGRAVPYVRFFVQAMSGVPSVVAGLFILTVLILSGALGASAFAGGLAYAILMLPTVARTAEEVLRLVPEDLRTGALALGSTRARTVLQVVIPAAKTGIVTAIVLGVARVVGETAPLLLVIGVSDKTVLDPFNSPITALPTYIFDNVAQPYPDAVSRAWGAALVLIIVVAILFVTTRILGRGRLK
ncbi:MAG: phosphate transporter permease PstA [Actinomycetota bacterium]|jgi:phosphate transport system permease protein